MNRRSLMLFCFCLHLLAADLGARQPAAYTDRFDEISRLVTESFYDSARIARDWPRLQTKYRPDLDSVSSERAFARLINRMLGDLGTSHTRYYTADDLDYYHLAAIFDFLPAVRAQFGDSSVSYFSPGLLTREIDGQLFIAAVLPGGAAAQAGLLRGDELIAVDDKPGLPMRLLQQRGMAPLAFKIRRHAGDEPFAIALTPVAANPKAELLAAAQQSIRLIEAGRHRIGYIHLLSYAGEAYHQVLLDAMRAGPLREADALIWDVRDGWGGANPEYLQVFSSRVPVLAMRDRSGTLHLANPRWDRPVVMLINRGVRSGKELLAFGFKKLQIGTLIGERTAGATLGGRLFVLQDGALLYLPVVETLVDGVRLEGVGVAPDLAVPDSLPYSAGADAPLAAAVRVLQQQLSR